MSDKNALLKFNGNKHYLNQVLVLAGSGPDIAVNISDLDMETLVDTLPFQESVEIMPVVFYKLNGKYVVLAGKQRVVNAIVDQKKTVVKGKLLSTPALKKARVPEPVVEAPEPATYTPEFANRPRLVHASNPKPRYEDHSVTRVGRGLYRASRG